MRAGHECPYHSGQPNPPCLLIASCPNVNVDLLIREKYGRAWLLSLARGLTCMHDKAWDSRGGGSCLTRCWGRCCSNWNAASWTSALQGRVALLWQAGVVHHVDAWNEVQLLSCILTTMPSHLSYMCFLLCRNVSFITWMPVTLAVTVNAGRCCVAWHMLKAARQIFGYGHHLASPEGLTHVSSTNEIIADMPIRRTPGRPDLSTPGIEDGLAVSSF